MNASRPMWLVGTDEEGRLRMWHPKDSSRPSMTFGSLDCDGVAAPSSITYQHSESAHFSLIPGDGGCPTMPDAGEFEAGNVSLKVMSGHDQPAATLRLSASERQREKMGIAEINLKGMRGDCINIVLQPPEANKAGNVVGALHLSQDVASVHSAILSPRRKSAPSALAASSISDEVRQFMAKCNLIYIVIDADSRITDWNYAASESVGFKAEEVINKPLLELTDTDDAKHLPWTHPQQQEFVLSIRRKSGESSTKLLMKATAVRCPSGLVTEYALMGHDFTDRWHEEQKNQHIAQELQAFMRSANAPIFGTDLQGRINEWNEKAHEITGFSTEEVLGRYLIQDFVVGEDFFLAEQKEQVTTILNNALSGHETSDFEIPLTTADKRPIVVLLNVTTKRNVAGEPIGVIGFGQDITERKTMESEKERIAQELQRFIETANASIFGVDCNGLVNEWNNKVQAITGHSHADTIGRHFVRELLREEDRESVSRVIENALNGIPTGDFEFPLYTKDNKRVDMLLNVTSRCDLQGNVVGVIAVGQDITLKNQAQMEISAVAKELRAFIDSANAPIFGIDERGLVNEWNNKAHEITGFSKDDALGQDFVQVRAYDDAVCEYVLMRNLSMCVRMMTLCE
jgi:PAS domain S-box-containing protein